MLESTYSTEEERHEQERRQDQEEHQEQKKYQERSTIKMFLLKTKAMIMKAAGV